MSKDSSLLAPNEEVLSTLTKEGRRRWLYPKLAQGSWHSRRRVVSWLLVAIYLAIPFLSIDGKPVILLDIFKRQFTILGQTFFATDSILLLLLLLSLVLTIVACSAVFGRVWCGWACPQTVYLEFVFRPIERWIEGPPAKRMKRDQGAVTFDKLWRKSLKYLLYLLVAWVLSNSFVAYFVGGPTILKWMTLSPLEHPTPFIIMLLVTGAIVFNFAYFREQLCTIACPYARLQSVLLDPNSVIVAYDKIRGEPRGKGRRTPATENLGDCVDCGMCVAVCPTGIDIRKGLQMECIHCTQCIDACDAVMRQIERPSGLIRYSSLAELRGSATHYLRPRTILYAALLTTLLGILITQTLLRPKFEVQLFRAPGTTFSQLPDGRLTNMIRLKFTNHSETPARFELQLLQPSDAHLVAPELPITVPVSQVVTTNAFVEFEPESEASSHRLRIEAHGPENYRQQLEIPLLTPPH